MEIRLDGRTALITGGSKGLGKAMAVRMAGAGARVIIVARRADVLEEARVEIAKASGGGEVLAFPCDVTDPAAIQNVWRRAASEAGLVDILVNNAGSSARGPFVDVTDDEWQADLDLKLFAQIRFSRLAFPAMRERRWGRIINVLNTGAKTPPAEGAPTAVTRAAGLALTKVLANEGAPHNVLVSALCTGLIESDQWVRRHATIGTGTYDEFLSEMGNNIPMGRVGTSEEFANVACFLASDLASYVTGVAVNVDGGKSPVT